MVIQGGEDTTLFPLVGLFDLLGIQTQAELERSPFLGSIFEGYVAAEIFKNQVNRGHRKELYYFRDQRKRVVFPTGPVKVAG